MTKFHNKTINNIIELNEREKDLLKFIYNYDKNTCCCTASTDAILLALNLTMDRFKKSFKNIN